MADLRVGQRGRINGELVEWDGKGWLPVAETPSAESDRQAVEFACD